MTEWRDGLAGLTGEQIAHGLETWTDAWPPSLPEFRDACLGTGDGWEHLGAAYKPFPKALPRPKCDPDVVNAELEKMRQALK